ncbi:MAG TPA: hypothetical protein VFF40_02525 [Acidimicrobiia bacterium]|nr:hypothetical protein [Acidimicrobiia bacterium]
MTRLITCSDCREVKPHQAKGRCSTCYKRHRRPPGRSRRVDYVARARTLELARVLDRPLTEQERGELRQIKVDNRDDLAEACDAVLADEPGVAYKKARRREQKRAAQQRWYEKKKETRR